MTAGNRSLEKTASQKPRIWKPANRKLSLPEVAGRHRVAGSFLPCGFPRGTSNSFAPLTCSARQNSLFCLFTIKVPPSKSVNLDRETSISVVFCDFFHARFSRKVFVCGKTLSENFRREPFRPAVRLSKVPLLAGFLKHTFPCVKESRVGRLRIISGNGGVCNFILFPPPRNWYTLCRRFYTQASNNRSHRSGREEYLS